MWKYQAMNPSTTTQPPRRILIFSFAYYPRFVGGAEVAIKEITDRIDPSKMAFDLVTLRLDRNLPAVEKVGNVTVYRVGLSTKRSPKVSPDSLPWYLHLNKYFFLWTGWRRAAALHRANHYDAIWSLMASYSSFAAIIFKLTHPTVPFVFTLQDGDPIPYIEHRARPLWPLFRRMFTKADHVQAISKYLADWARQMGATCPVTVIPNAVDYELFTAAPSPAESRALRAKLTKGPEDVFLVTTSRLVVKNAIGDVIEAMKYLPANIKFLVLGQGYQLDELKKLSLRLGLNYTDEPPWNPGNRVHFLGYVPHRGMPPYLHVSDIFIRPSRSEGLGNSFLEAMAAGVPVIATPVGGIPDFLIEGETGLFCEIGNPRSIAQKVEKLLKDREARSYLVSRARTMVRERYRWEGVAGEMQNIFSAVVVK